MSARPEPRPGVLEIEAYVPGKSARAGRRQGPQAVLERDAARPVARRRVEAYPARRDQLELYPDGSATRLREAIAREVRPRSGAHRLRLRLRRAAVAASPSAYVGPGRRGRSSREHGFLVYRIAILAAGGTPVVGAGDATTRADVDAHPRRGDAADQGRLPRQPQQPDRHLPALRRGEAAACRPAAARAPRPRRGLCRICPPQRLRVRPRARRRRRRTS